MDTQQIARVVFPALLALLGPAALAGGGPSVSGTLAVYQCQGGLRVQVDQVPNSQAVRVTYAGQSFLLRPVPNGDGTSFQNVNLRWTDGSTTSFMRNRQTGKIIIRGCVQQ